MSANVMSRGSAPSPAPPPRQGRKALRCSPVSRDARWQCQLSVANRSPPGLCPGPCVPSHPGSPISQAACLRLHLSVGAKESRLWQGQKEPLPAGPGETPGLVRLWHGKAASRGVSSFWIISPGRKTKRINRAPGGAGSDCHRRRRSDRLTSADKNCHQTNLFRQGEARV